MSAVDHSHHVTVRGHFLVDMYIGLVPGIPAMHTCIHRTGVGTFDKFALVDIIKCADVRCCLCSEVALKTL